MSFFRFVSDCDEEAAAPVAAASATVAPDPGLDDYTPPLPRPAYRQSWRGQFRPATVSALEASVNSGAGLDVLAQDNTEVLSADAGADRSNLLFPVLVIGLIYALSR